MTTSRLRTFTLATLVATASAAVVPPASAQEFGGIVPNVISHSAAGASLSMTPIGSYSTGLFAESAAEIVAFHAPSQRILTVNATSGEVDILDASDPRQLQKVGAISAGEGREINSVAVRADGLAVAAVQAPNKTDNGEALFFDAAGDAAELGRVSVGALPDNVSLSKDGRYALVANEGEPSNELNPEGTAYTADPAGSVSIIALPDDVAAATQADVRTAGFEAYDSPGALDPSIRVFGPSGHHNKPSLDFEPEYVAPASNGKAYVSIQEANAIGIIDIESATVEKVVPAHIADHSVSPIDPSNKDGAARLRTLPVKGLSMPDSMAAFESGGQTFIAAANEGDAREWGVDEDEGGSGVYTDEIELKDVIRDGLVCEGALSDTDTAALADAESAGNLKLSAASGWDAENGCFDELHAYGSRSFSIYDSAGNVVFDSGAEFEQITAALHEQGELVFNADNEGNDFDDRSDNKGPEPEALTVGRVGERTYAFIGAERVGGIFVYDITDPANATFQTYVNNRDFHADPESPQAGDLGPEGFSFVPDEDSPTGKDLLIVGNEVSGTTTVYEIEEALSSSDAAPSSPSGSSTGGTVAAVIAAVLGIAAALLLSPSILNPLVGALPDSLRAQIESALGR